MSDEIAQQVLTFISNDLVGLDGAYVHFFGGEPLIRPRTVDRLAGALREIEREQGKRIRLGITTNGTLLSQENCLMLGGHGIGVQLSLDGAERGNDVHRQLMGGSQYGLPPAGAFRMVRIDNYLSHFGKDMPNCRMTVTVDNLGYLSESVQELRRLGFKSFSIVPDFESAAWTTAQLTQYESEMQQLFEYWARNRDISLNVVDQMIRKLVYRRPRTHMCNAGLRVIGITIDGDIYPCHDFAGRYSQDSDRRNALLIGNVRTGYAAGKKGFGEFRIGPEIRSGAGFDCGTCWARWACSRGCPYMNYTVSGDLRTVNPNYCATTRIGASVALRWISALDDCGLTPPKFGRGRAGSPAVVQVQSDKSPFVSQGAAEHVAPGATA